MICRLAGLCFWWPHIDHDVLEIIRNFKAYSAPLRNIRLETIGIRDVSIGSG